MGDLVTCFCPACHEAHEVNYWWSPTEDIPILVCDGCSEHGYLTRDTEQGVELCRRKVVTVKTANVVKEEFNNRFQNK